VTVTTRRNILGVSVVALSAVLGLGASCVSVRAEGPPPAAAAPAFSLTDHRGQQVSLAQLTDHGPAVLVFYRGHW